LHGSAEEIALWRVSERDYDLLIFYIATNVPVQLGVPRVEDLPHVLVVREGAVVVVIV
jgi:hypothetical protein